MMKRGIVVSDLHLFAKRSRGAAFLKSIGSRLGQVDLLVLNGDIFDFRWSMFPDHEATARAARDWLEKLVVAHPKCRVHYVMGNHDCLHLFKEHLATAVETHDRFRWHEHFLCLGQSLFLHGDCAHQTMDVDGFSRYRKSWERDRRRSALAAASYKWCVDTIGVTRLVHHVHFPRRRTVKRIAHYLDHSLIGWRERVRDCYFGHTHLPFENFQHDGVRFHNTGSAIWNMPFRPIEFAVE